MSNICIGCTKSLPDNPKVIFCPFCLTQIKCKSCDEFLIKDAVGCISCGTPITLNNDKSAQNHIEFEQKGDLKKFKATFTDNVGHDLVATFGGMVGVPQIKKKSVFLPLSNNTLTSSTSEDIIDIEISEDEEQIKEVLSKIFKIDGDKLVFMISSYKEKNKIEKEIRISLLTLLGYKFLHNADEIKRTSLNEILKRSKLNTGNFRKWISNCDEIVQTGGGMIALTPDGYSKAIKVLTEVVDPNISEGSIDFSKQKGRSSKSRINKSDSTNSNQKSGKSPKTYLEKVIDENFFTQKRSLSDIIKNLKDNHAVTFKTSDISGHMGNYVRDKVLKREKGDSGYEYFI